MSPEREEADLLLRKAAEDEAVLVALVGNEVIADSVLGFHAQQAVEKALKWARQLAVMRWRTALRVDEIVGRSHA